MFLVGKSMVNHYDCASQYDKIHSCHHLEHDHVYSVSQTFEFSLNISTEFNDKNIILKKDYSNQQSLV